MKGNRRADTKPEVSLRSLLHRRGLRFRKDLTIDLGPGRKPRPDIVFTRQKVAVFVDGCFWHMCPEHGRLPGGQNAAYWKSKFQRNRERDLDDTSRLQSAGWTVLRIWEHVDPQDAANRIVEAVTGRSTSASEHL